jgi:hypothetical protein
MKSRLRFALLIPLATLLGCTLPTTPTTGTPPAPTGNWDNWQIQAGTTITSPPAGLYFVGAVQIQGTQASAVFTTSGFGAPSAGNGTEVLDFSGTYNSSTGLVDLLPATSNSAAYGIGFAAPSTNTVIPIGIVTGCVYPLNYTGVECLALIAIDPAVGVEIAPLNGTYVGTLTDSAAPSMSGTGSLTLTQSTTPNADGSFSLTGTLTFPASSGFGTQPLSGTISGEGITLYDPTPGIVPVVSLTASTNPAATQITVSDLAFAVTASDIVTFTGTLTLQ